MPPTDGDWTTEKQALETRGANHVRVLEITLTDPEGYGPNSGWYTSTKVLRLVDDVQLMRTSSGTVDKEYWPAVLEWGTSYQSQDFGAAFSTVSDCQYILKNAKISPQLPGSLIDAATASTPEPMGDDIRLSDLMRYYEWTGAVVTDKILSFEDASLNQVSAAYQETTIFSGIISNVTVSADQLLLDVIESDKERRSKVGQTFVTSPQDRIAKGEMIPVLFGEFSHEAAEGTWGVLDQHKTLAGGRPSLVKCVQWRMGDAGVSGENASDTRYAWYDASGPNTGWTTQPDWGTTDDSPTEDEPIVVRYIQDSDSYVLIDIGTSEGQTEWVDNPTGAGTGLNDQLYVRTNKYLTGYAYIPCEALQEYAGTAPTNPENMANREFSNYMTFDLQSTSNICLFRIPEIAPLGTIPIEADSIEAWLCYSIPVSDIGDPAEWSLGFWRGTISGGAAASNSTTGTLTSITQTTPRLLRQTQMVSGATASNFIAESYRESWLWKESAASVRYPLYVRLACTATSAVSTTMRVYGVGIRVKCQMARGSIQTYQSTIFDMEQAAALLRAGGKVVGWAGRFPVIRWKHDSRTPSSVNLYVVPTKTSIDDASGTISGSAEASLTSPAYQAALALLRYGDGVTSASMSFSTSSGADGFGSVRNAATDLDDWAQNIDGGGSATFKTALRINTGSTVGETVNAISDVMPLMVYRKSDGDFNFCVYPNAHASIPTRMRYVNNAGNQVYFHPNLHHEDATRYGQPYSFTDLRAYLSPVEEVFTDFRIEYNFHPPTNSYSFQQFASPDGYSIWDETSNTFETSSNTLGGLLLVRATEGLSRLGYQRTHATLQLDNVNDDTTAAAVLDYMVYRHSIRRVIVEATVFMEAYDLLSGHVITIDNDTNLVMPVPAYAKEDWEDLDFVVLEVRQIPSPHGFKVWFRAEQLARA